MRRVLQVLTVALACATPAGAQDRTVWIDVEPVPAHVGDRITITISVDHPAADSLVWPEIVEGMGSFEVLDAELLRPVENGDRLTSSLRLVVTAFELGELEFPGLTVHVVSGDGGTTELATDPLTVSLESVGLDDTGDIRDIKPPLFIARSWIGLGLLGLVFAALGALSYWLYRRYRRRAEPQKRAVPKPVSVLAPDEEAFKAFDRLQASTLLDRGETKRYHVEASLIIRVYVHRRFGIDALEMASHDILAALRRERLPLDLHQSFTEFLDRCDLVKFAKHRPARHRSDELVPRGRALVTATTPSEPVVPAEPAAA